MLLHVMWRRNMLRRHPDTGEVFPDEKTGRVIPVTDYPYADDGLQVWYALMEWFTAYLKLYYSDSDGSASVCNFLVHIPWGCPLSLPLHAWLRESAMYHTSHSSQPASSPSASRAECSARGGR